MLSRLEFDYEADLGVLTEALTPAGPQPTKIPFRMSEYSNPEESANMRVRLSDPLKSWIVKPFMVLTTQAKSSMDSIFPSRSWIQNDSTRPVSYLSLKNEHQAWSSHEFALVQYRNGMATDAKVDANNRGYAFGGSNSLFGSSFFVQRELALSPVQSVAQLSHFDLAASPFAGAADHPVGNSFASPMVQSGEFRTGEAVDHAWLANFRLWDSWYASTYANQRPPYWPVAAELTSVVDGFLSHATRLPNPRFSPWTGERTPDQIGDLLTQSNSEAKTDGYRVAAATQLLDGAFNINSTSKAAWMALLGGLDRETISSLLFDGDSVTFSPDGITTDGPFLSRKHMPFTKAATTNLANPERFSFWNGGCELTHDELEALAAGIVREIKLRGPFLSLSEFVNRRIGPESAFSLKGAIQAAIDDAPGIGGLNTNSQSRKDLFNELSRTITEADTHGIPYPYRRAALGHSASGASGGLDQLAVLNQIGTSISARSDTFRIRCYGDTIDNKGKVLAQAWCEAIVQRVPDYLLGKSDSGNDPWESDSATLHPVNQVFGRRFEIVSLRWLTENEI